MATAFNGPNPLERKGFPTLTYQQVLDLRKARDAYPPVTGTWLANAAELSKFVRLVIMEECGMAQAEPTDASRFRKLREWAMRLSLPNDTIAMLLKDVITPDATIKEMK